MALQDFIGIASSAPEPVRAGDTSAQIPAALYQRAEQNSRYLMEWRGPTCVWHYPADYSGGEGVGPSFPKLAFANWAAFGPYRYHVPDVGTGGIPAVDVQIVGNVSTRRVRVAMISNQGLGFIPNAEWLDANAQTISPGLQEILFSDVAVAPGWNDLFLLLESEAEWSTVNFADDWYLSGSSLVFGDEALTSTPVLVSTAGDLAISCPDINKPVPFVAIRFGSGLTDKVQDLASGSVCTIALANCDASDPPVVKYAFLAELNNYGSIEGVATSDTAIRETYWSTLGTLEIYSVAVTPYANHPDKANDPSLRFLQAIGSNVANVYWKGSRLNALRQTQVGSGVPRQLGTDYNGVLKAIARKVNPYLSPQLIRETSISTRGVQPTEGDGAVSIEMSIPVISQRFTEGGVRVPIILDCRLELFNVTTGAVVDYIQFDNLAVPASSYIGAGGTSGGIASQYWFKRVALLTEDPTWRGATSVQPWSHDGATTIEDITSTFYPLILRLSLGDGGNSPDSWKLIRQSGDLFSVRFIVTDFSQPFLNHPTQYLGFGAMTARIDWGT